MLNKLVKAFEKWLDKVSETNNIDGKEAEKILDRHAKKIQDETGSGYQYIMY
jgi:hypothetical protein